MSAHQASQSRGVFAALAAQLSAYLLEPAQETVEPQPAQLEPYPVIAVVASSPGCGASTVARLLAAQLAASGGGAVVVAGPAAASGRRGAALPTRAAARLATALAGAASSARPAGRLCLAHGEDPLRLFAAARYLAPVVVDVAADGSALGVARHADHTVVVARASAEPALAAAVARVLGGEVVSVVNRVVEQAEWLGRADVFLPDARVGARAAGLGVCAMGALGAAVAQLADALGVD